MTQIKTVTTKTATKMLFGAALAGALLLAAPHRAQAQVGFGVQIGNYPPPPYAYDNTYAYTNGYYNNGYYYANDPDAYWRHEQHERWEAQERAEHWRHEQWEHSRDRDYDRDRYRDHDDHRDRW